MWRTPPFLYEQAPDIPIGMTAREYRVAHHPKVSTLAILRRYLPTGAGSAGESGRGSPAPSPSPDFSVLRRRPPTSAEAADGHRPIARRPHPSSPPCGGRCGPEGCFSDCCWVDRDTELRRERLHGETDPLWESWDPGEPDDDNDRPF